MTNSDRIYLISVDEIKKSLDGYTPDQADKFHQESVKIADALLKKELKKIKNKPIILMCGGSASGKTEFIEKFFVTNSGFDGIIYDGTLSSIEGAKAKIRNIKRYGNNAIICLILPDNLKNAFAAFNKRDRKIPINRFYETHNGSRKVAFFIKQNYNDIDISIYLSVYFSDENKEQLLFLPLIEKKLTSLLEKIQISEEEIKKDVEGIEDKNLHESLGYKFLFKKL